MARKRVEQQSLLLPQKVIEETQVEYLSELETNPKYSLEVDPENKYNLSDIEKEFIKYYINYRNVNTSADLCGIEMDTAKQIFKSYPVQTEIRRINMALYQRQFGAKLLSLDELGGYLSSVLTDQYVPLAEQLSTNEKLRVVDTLIKLNQMKSEAMKNPEIIIEKDLNSQLKDLSVEAIKALITQTNNNTEDKIELIGKIDIDNSLSIEEKAYLETLSTTELLKLINETTKKGGTQ